MEKIITFGEIMLRLTPPEYTKINQANSFNANYGGGEANVAVSLSHLGHKNTFFLSKLPPNELGDSAIQHLRSHGVNTDYVVRGSTTLGIYFLETGFGGRPSKVIYNRKHSAITRVDPLEFDMDEIFKDATWFHVSGISLALGDRVRNTVLKLLEACKKYGVKVSFDFNYISKLWTIEEARPWFKKVMPYVDVLFVSFFDANTILEYQPDNEMDNEVERCHNVFQKVIEDYGVTYVFGTKRIIHSANENSLSAYYFTKEEKTHIDPIRFNIYDRIGGGDAFASGVIHGLLKDFSNPAYAVHFGLVTSVLKHTIYGDVSVLSESDIQDYIRTNGIQGVDR